MICIILTTTTTSLLKPCMEASAFIMFIYSFIQGFLFVTHLYVLGLVGNFNARDFCNSLVEHYIQSLHTFQIFKVRTHFPASGTRVLNAFQLSYVT